ncbi:MAG TPA: hypothetical protein VMI75_39630 [Polyangiaceae bacterium]|nr:hypothetical protein [Polyangiaceae bacterium]
MIRKLLGATLVCAFFVACGSGDSSNEVPVTGTDAATEAGTTGNGFSGSSSGSGSGSGGSGSGGSYDGGSDSGAGGACGACTSDSQCQSMCPAVSGGGTNCCEVGSGICYATTTATCPAAVDAGGPG